MAVENLVSALRCLSPQVFNSVIKERLFSVRILNVLAYRLHSIIRHKATIFFIVLSTASTQVFAEPYRFIAASSHGVFKKSIAEACQVWFDWERAYQLSIGWIPSNFRVTKYTGRRGDVHHQCRYDAQYSNDFYDGSVSIGVYGDRCSPGLVYNDDAGTCIQPAAPQAQNCQSSTGPSPRVLNPVSVMTGGKFQTFVDIDLGSLSLERTYMQSEEGGNWYFPTDERLDLVNLYGDDTYLHRSRGYLRQYKHATPSACWSSFSGDCVDIQVESDQVKFVSDTGARYFNKTTGKLEKIIDKNNPAPLHLIHTTNTIVLTRLGKTLTLTLNNHGHVISASADEQTVSYTRDSHNMITRVTWSNGDTEYYEYKDTRPTYLIEMGINDAPFAYWEYDEFGRVIKSRHEGNLDIGTMAYSEHATTVTNALGKSTTYHFQHVNGVRKISSVSGHASENCAAANRSYTYHDNGLLASKTDWAGNTITYTYDERGLETSRTEAMGTDAERTITTEWHSSFRLPVKITEPEQVTNFSYNATGQLLSQELETRAVP